MKIRFRTVFWIATALIVAALLVFAFRPQPVAVDVAQTLSGPMRVTVRDEGRTRVRDEYIVSAPVAGQLLRVDFKPGALVHAGDSVARIRPGAPAFLDARALAEGRAAVNSAEAALSGAQSELQRAQAQADFAAREAARIEELRSRDLVSVEAFDRARLDLRVAETALSSARQNQRIREAELDAARVRLTQPNETSDEPGVVDVTSPVSGRVLRVAQESASVIMAGAEVMSIGDPSEIEVVVELLSTDAVQVQPGADVIIENWGRDNTPLHGTVRLVEPYGFLKVSALGVEEQRVNVIVDFVGPPEEWSSLGHGYRVEAAIVTWEEDDVIQAPVAALFRRGGQWAVFRIESERARLTPVEIGRDNGRNAQVLSGIEAGETIILYPSEQVSDGSRVSLRSVSE